MEPTSAQAFDSDESERSLGMENFDGHDFVDDELSKNVDLCFGDDDKIIQPLHQIATSDDNDIEPRIGMEFGSRDDARDFYIAYGRHEGFTVRIHHNRRSRINNMVIGQDFVCSKEGFREKKYVHRKDRVLPPPPVTREGCHAMLRVALRDGVKWVITKFVKDHNHSLMSPNKVPWRGSGRSLISKDEKDHRIKELTLELYNERQRCKRHCAAYQEQLRTLLKYVEDHTSHMSKSVEEIVQRVRALENEELDDSN